MTVLASHAAPPLRLVAWELTRSCVLRCRHCRGSASAGPYENELSTEECERVLLSIISFAKPIVILTGGEPMLRPDVYRLARLGSGLGARMAMAPCGLLLDKKSCGRIVESGPTRSVTDSPRHPYTLALMRSTPIPDPSRRNLLQVEIRGEVPSSINPPLGCRFNPRCPYAEKICSEVVPPLKEIAPSHFAACHFVEKTANQ